jgi:hypothetical protein
MGPKFCVVSETTPREGLKEKMNPEAGEMIGIWLIWVPISAVNGEKLARLEV